MKYNIFISYTSRDTEIVENLKNQFIDYGISAWVYSLDRTLTEHAWKEIEKRITESDLVIFVVSESTHKSEGQMIELDLVLKRVDLLSGTTKFMPIFITGTNPSTVPEELRYKNGLFLDGHTVKSVAWQIANRVFPSLVQQESENPWKCPIPGECLEVTSLDEFIEEYFDIGDKLYFRAVSPMGLLECYSPKIKDLFWIAPENVRSSRNIESNKSLENEVPEQFRVIGMIEIQRLGWKAWHANKQEHDL